MSPELEQLAYPIGRFEAPLTYDETLLQQWITKIEATPKWYDYVIENLDEAQLETPYRPGGWTMNQVVHHMADSHINAYVRLKLALTEQSPEIKPYAEKRWAELPDVAALPVNVSITLLHVLHRRWVAVLHHLQPEDWKRTYFHPETQRSVPLWEMTAMYAWHGRHHFEQLFRLRERMGW
ncbi:YfiT family bacillithiol transferase [Taibaiella helva]|uniref:YfiT family bacillithiol transferase n=1 Tax=Taibaiella helva TaxID=2301235 RepID=UPI000E598D58|nr:putative metal-dependent hydrolase [Taibaiella helva]